MRPISPKNKAIIDSDPYYKRCARSDEGDCSGRITIEHAWIYAGRQIDEIWNLLPICTFHHAVNEHQDGGNLDKDLHHLLAIERADMDDICARMSKKNWRQELSYLRDKFNRP